MKLFTFAAKFTGNTIFDMLIDLFKTSDTNEIFSITPAFISPGP